MRVAGVDLEVRVDGELHESSHLAVLVTDNGAAKLRRELGALVRERVAHNLGGAIVGNVEYDHESAGSLDGVPVAGRTPFQ